MKFSNKEIEQIPLDNLTVAQFLITATDTLKLLGWTLGDMNNTGFVAYTKNGLFSWNAQIRLKIDKRIATIQSESRGDSVIDVRENKKNLRSFITAFNNLKKTLPASAKIPPHEKLKSNFSLN